MKKKINFNVVVVCCFVLLLFCFYLGYKNYIYNLKINQKEEYQEKINDCIRKVTYGNSSLTPLYEDYYITYETPKESFGDTIIPKNYKYIKDFCIFYNK